MGEGSRKTNILGKLPKKWGLEQFAGLRGDLTKNRGQCFSRGRLIRPRFVLQSENYLFEFLFKESFRESLIHPPFKKSTPLLPISSFYKNLLSSNKIEYSNWNFMNFPFPFFTTASLPFWHFFLSYKNIGTRTIKLIFNS